MDEDVIAKVRELLGEYASAWAIVAEDAEGEFWHEYSTPIVARALHDYAIQRISHQLDFDGMEIEWEECEDEDGDDWKNA